MSITEIKLNIKKFENKKTNSFTNDLGFEKKSSRFLEDNFPFHEDFGIDYEVKSKDIQLSGIDYVAHVDNEVQNIDAKAIASDLGTFSFELSGNHATDQIGWLLQDNATSHFLLIYHKFFSFIDEGYLRNKSKDFNKSNIKETELLLIQKDSIKKIYNDFIANLQHSSGIIKELRWLNTSTEKTTLYIIENERLKEVSYLESESHDVKIVVSNRVKEKPINLVVKKSLLRDVSEKIVVY